MQMFALALRCVGTKLGCNVVGAPARRRGLRAIKSVLVVAGSLLRAEEGQVESQVLFRALRDFNVPKILMQARAARRGAEVAALSCLPCPALLGARPKRPIQTQIRYRKPFTPSFSRITSPPQDMVIFMGLLNDLFPGVDPPRKRDLAFEEVRRAAAAAPRAGPPQQGARKAWRPAPSPAEKLGLISKLAANGC
jgi:hypothetical protein